MKSRIATRIPNPCSSARLRSTEKAAGPEHPAVATLLNNIGQVDKVQGRYAEAEPLIKRSLMIREKVLGARSSGCCALLNNLCGSSTNGRAGYADAGPLTGTAATIREAALGANHPDTAISLNNLASLYQTEGRTADALPIVQRMIATGRAQLRVALPVLFAAQRQQLISNRQGARRRTKRPAARHPILRGGRGQQARGTARRRERPARAVRPPRSGSRRRSRGAGQGDRRRRVPGTFEARPRRRAAQPRTAGNDFGGARGLAKNLRRRIPGIMRRCQIRCQMTAKEIPGAVIRR